MDDAHGVSDGGETVATRANQLRNDLHLPPDAADAAARDLEATGRRKPASNDVDSARAAEARADGGEDDTDLHEFSDADPDFDVDPHSEEMKKIDDSVERAAW